MRKYCETHTHTLINMHINHSRAQMRASCEAGERGALRLMCSFFFLHKGGAVSAADIFGVLAKTVQADPSLVQKVKGVYHFKINTASNGLQSWTVDLKNGSGR